MHFVVCAKQIPDPETPPSAFSVNESTNEVVPAPGIAAVLSQFDGIAAEAALRIREATDDEVRITVLLMGKENALPSIKQVLAMGADEGVLLQDDAFEGGDWYTTVRVLSTAIQKLGDVDGVFCGRQAADWDMGQTGLGLAESLGWPCAIIARDVGLQDGSMSVQRVLADGFETVRLPLPAVVTVSNEFGEPRYPKLKEIMQAARKSVTTWTAADLELDPSTVGAAGSRLKLERLFIPEAGGNVQIMEGDTPEEQAQNLVSALREAKLL